ncbi:hypothetical protein [Streptomyces sp. TRM68367]|uniref:hypothetical protein n=1 Tax=Streptomyces sp. TRM68367 TaxID=2758415 RepID=UPI0021D0CB60|nr:hypothetical protein [Streptomyces sp. TRM68367]
MDNAKELQILGVEGMALPPMSIHLPEGLHAIEVSLDETERAEAVQKLVRDIYPRGEEPLWASIIHVRAPAWGGRSGLRIRPGSSFGWW